MSLTTSQYDNIMKTYDETRNRNQEIHQERVEKIYSSIPRMTELDDRLHAVARKRLQMLLGEGDDTQETQVEDTVSQIASERRALLLSSGYPEDYLDPIYTCKDCKDTGYILKEDSTREKCHCFLNQEATFLFQQSNIQNMFQQENFSTLSYEYCQGEDLERLKRAVSKCFTYLKEFDENYTNLLFYGTVGTGKSFLSGCVARELLLHGHSVVYFSASDFFATLSRHTFDIKEKETLYNFNKQLYNYDCLIIDDLGTEMTNQFVASSLFACLNERHLRKKSTIISTNLSLEEIRDRYSDRVFSRIYSNFTACKLTGPDVRMCKRNQ